MIFSEKDIQHINAHGLSIDEVTRQLNILNKGLPPTKVLAPATIENKGIIKLDSEQQSFYQNFFEQNKDNFHLQKFVPASGAATRMFKDWVFFYNNYQAGKDYYERFVKKHALNMPEYLNEFLEDFAGYAFYQDLMEIIKIQEPDFFQLDENQQAWKYLHYILTDHGLDYARLPKAFIKFHRYKQNETRTAFEEQLVETMAYTTSKTQQGSVHFSISPRHLQQFENLSQHLQNKYPVQIFHSFQKPETDTVMLDMESGEIVRDKNGKIVFRPGGHGSLIDNIQDLDADLIFVKNIDNVQKGERQNTGIFYKKILAGYLMNITRQAHAYLKKLQNEKPIHEELKAIENFARNTLNINFIEGFDTLNNSGKRKYLFYKINRPIRVAGMVKNTGEPGGGPFWAKDQNELKSLQIVEKAQIDTNNPEQQNILKQATHFNPVDLVLSIKDFEGNKFNLKELVNENAGFVTEKSYEGKPVKVYERPGLWNGAMDNWNTIFIEVPLETFSPVKTVSDLLKPEHQ